MTTKQARTERSLFESIRHGVETKTGKIAAGTLIVLGAATLSACASEETPPPVPSETATPTPSKSETPTPEPEVLKFEGEVNYTDFEGWETKDEKAKLEACAKFFELNKPDSDVVWTDKSSGSDIASHFNAMFLVAAKLNADTSNPQNRVVADDIIQCMSVQYSTDDLGYESLDVSLELNDGTNTKEFLPSINPEKITSYSDGTFTATNYENVIWTARTIEGQEYGIAKRLITQIFEWNTTVPNFPIYRLSFVSPTALIEGTDNNYFGDKPPIVVG